MKTKNLLLYLTALVLISNLISGCKKDSIINNNSLNPSIKNDKSGLQTLPSQAYPAGIGQPITFNMNDGSTIIIIKVNNEYVLGGDVILSSEQLDYLKNNSSKNKLSVKSRLKTESTFTSSFNKLWPGGIVYYTINNPVNQNTIITTINYYQSVTKIKFVARTNQANYVEFDPSPSVGAAGDSQIGMVGGKQLIRLADYVDEGSIIHEIGHTLGLFHEQTRADRDAYINVNYNNINSSWKSQYDIYSGLSGFEIGPFDFASVMLYSSYYPQIGYAGNSIPQMTKKSDGSTWYQGSNLSTGDISGINFLYFNGLFCRLRYVQTANNPDQNGGGYWAWDVFVDFFQDANCRIPKILDTKTRINFIETYIYYYDNAGDSRTTITSFYRDIPSGSSSFDLGGLVSSSASFAYDGTENPGSYDDSIQSVGGVGYIRVSDIYQ